MLADPAPAWSGADAAIKGSLPSAAEFLARLIRAGSAVGRESAARNIHIGGYPATGTSGPAPRGEHAMMAGTA